MTNAQPPEDVLKDVFYRVMIRRLAEAIWLDRVGALPGSNAVDRGGTWLMPGLRAAKVEP
jgi:hypothetical protein